MEILLKDAESSQFLMYLSKSPHVRPWCPDRCPDDTSRLAKCFAATLVTQSHMLQLFGNAVLSHLAPSFGAPSSLCTPIGRNLNGKCLVTWEVMQYDPCHNPFAWKLLIEKGFH
jgi:hypothetical protein